MTSPIPRMPRLEPIRMPEEAKKKRTEPIEIDGVWYGPNACRECGKWTPPYKGAVPVEIAGEYCWGHADRAGGRANHEMG